MLYNEAVISLHNFLSSDIIFTKFGKITATEVINDDAAVISNENVDLPKDGIGHQSGVYILYALSGEIYYIGKAAQNNLHEEVWGKLRTPSKNKNGTSYYPKNYFLNKNLLDKEAVNDVTNGNVKIGVIVISNNALSSLAEVYLQTLFYQKNKRSLPKLNSQIG